MGQFVKMLVFGNDAVIGTTVLGILDSSIIIKYNLHIDNLADLKVYYLHKF